MKIIYRNPKYHTKHKFTAVRTQVQNQWLVIYDTSTPSVQSFVELTFQLYKRVS